MTPTRRPPAEEDEEAEYQRYLSLRRHGIRVTPCLECPGCVRCVSPASGRI